MPLSHRLALVHWSSELLPRQFILSNVCCLRLLLEALLHCSQLGWSQLATAVIKKPLIALVDTPQLLSNKHCQIQLGQGVVLQLNIILQQQLVNHRGATSLKHGCLQCTTS
jgi:hypothetical protein